MRHTREINIGLETLDESIKQRDSLAINNPSDNQHIKGYITILENMQRKKIHTKNVKRNLYRSSYYSNKKLRIAIKCNFEQLE